MSNIKQVRFNQLLITFISSLLMMVMIILLPKQAMTQTIGLDMIIRNADAIPDLRYYLYDENGNLLEDRAISKNTTVFASRYEVDKYIVLVKNLNGDTINQWELIPGIVDTSYTDPPPPPPLLGNYIHSDTNNVDLPTFTVERFYSTPILRVPVVDWIMTTDVAPMKGFGGLQRGWLKFGDQLEWVTYYGWGMSDQMDWGKFWFYVNYKGQWRGMVIEKDFIWMNSYLLLKKQPEPDNPEDGMIFRSMDGDLILYYDTIPHKILTDKVLESLMGGSGF